jgi:Tol biopolymer transport system component
MLKNIILTILVSLAVISSIYGQNGWEHRYETTYEDIGAGIVFYNNYLYVTGSKTAGDASKDFVTFRINPSNGTIPQYGIKDYHYLWGSSEYNDEPKAIAVSSSGNIYVAGYSSELVGVEQDLVSSYRVVKYNSVLTQQWTQSKKLSNEEPDDEPTQVNAIATRGDTCYVTGQAYNGDNYDYLTIKFKKPNDNTIKWNKTYDNGNDDFATAMAIDGSGNVYVTGYSEGANTGCDYATIKYSPNGGFGWTQQVERYNNSPTNLDDKANAIAIDPSGNIIVTGSSENTGTSTDFYTVKYYSSNGGIAWSKRYNNTSVNGADEARSIAVDGSGNIYVCGYTESTNGTDFLTLKYDASGNLKFQATFDGSGNGDDEAVRIVLDGGYVYVGGWSTGENTEEDYTVIKYDNSLVALDTWTYDFSGMEDCLTGFTVNSGNVYMTGTSYGNGSTDYDIATVKNTKTLLYDVRVLRILAPNPFVDSGTTITPKAKIHNNSLTQTVEVDVKFKIGNFYTCTVEDIELDAGEYEEITFDDWIVTQKGEYTAKCSVKVSDYNNENNFKTVNVSVAGSGWGKRENIPWGPKGKRVGKGGALAFCGSRLYALKGNGTTEFYRLLPGENTWEELANILYQTNDGKRKNVKGGGALAGLGGYVYALKGNNSQYFFRYDTLTMEWTELCPIPSGSPSKKVKDGAALVAFNGYIWALKGNNTKQFWRFDPNVTTNPWTSKGEILDKIKMGGALTYLADTIYALRGGNKTTFLRYDTNQNVNNWKSRADIPWKVKGGGALAKAGDSIYAFPGRKTRKFYSYKPNAWTLRCSIPSSSYKPVYNGGALAGTNGAVWALVGNKTNDVYRYLRASGGDGPGNDYTGRGGLPFKGGEESVIIEGVEGWRPQWSSDDEWIVYFTDDSNEYNRIYKIRPDGSELTCLTPDDADRECPRFSPNGEWIVYQKFDESNASYQIAYTTADDFNEIVLTDGPYDCEYPRWASDNDVIIYQKSDSTDWTQLYKISISNWEEIPLTSDQYDKELPSFDPNGNFLIYQKEDESDFYQIYKFSIDSLVETPLTYASLEREYPSSSPDGSCVVYQRLDENGYNQIYKVSTDEGDEIVLAEGLYDFEHPEFSSDSLNTNWVVFTAWNENGTSQICKVSPEGGEVTALTPDDKIRDYPSVSKDGKWIVYEATEIEPGGDDGKSRSGIYKIRLNSTGIADAALSKYIFYLHQNFPNPFQSRTTIRYSIPAQGKASLKIYDITGRQIRTLMNGIIKSGIYSAIWNGKDERGKKVASGIYFIELKTDKQRMQRKIILSH